ncbi:3-oxoacyl-ACP reductase FabG [Cocleimonas sp. KMM 6892]|uniref:3-oxoacyl-ACP reductase FabG n=1 Tax=unclassified Cocleimonas TaxID=2639732 RepID=UPI002DB59D1A|nr:MULTISPECIES: 3-oxoacyl-ACP reductase FabG [unclassified Cocleimonas]MEB8432447.1 3-oxoacyl-ACP reductase FabG [Cocleimonas sp. KMM 6892]MEC4715306.1 3-oxoacyl-ACP reductase FabG [Cocleimonas sp. KMM 6895]MEC4745075.1 3-oxoacyl-ACP reductase FabG [Cocleimonas sp. KMM 6896]
MSKKRVLVTGASRGIGKATAIELAADGFDVTVHYNSNQKAADEVLELIEKAGGSGQIMQFDIGDREQTKALLEADLEKNGAFYGVVCNAGIADDAAFPAMEAEQWDSVIHTNLDGFYNVLYPLIMPMIRLRQGGRIVTLTSVSGLIGNRGQVNYSAAKAGIIGASKSLAIELAKRKITVNSVAPGVIETDMTEGLFKEEAYVKEAKKMIPMGTFGQASDISSTISFLFSDKASYITRQTISVNGGMC